MWMLSASSALKWSRVSEWLRVMAGQRPTGGTATELAARSSVGVNMTESPPIHAEHTNRYLDLMP
jgi:hypothetical protein